MTADPIICFSKDWNEDPTSNHHVLVELARSRRVVWLNSIATRTPNLGSARDLGKIVNKVKSFTRGPENVVNDLWTYTPLVLPFPHSRLAQRVNAEILRATIWGLRKTLGIGDFELWTFLPNVGQYVGTLGEKLLVYYCIDEWSQFSYIDEAAMVRSEERLVDKADVIFACTDALAERKRQRNPNVHLAPHGVDHALFASALEDSTPLPEELAAIPHPIIGFYGTLQDWVDYELIAWLAERHRDWQFVLVGQALADVGLVARQTNVHLIGRKPHARLPEFCKAFDVGIIPYLLGERMKYVNPLKLREYLSAGLPVVSTAVPEVLRYADRCHIAKDREAFEAGIVAALGEGKPEARRRRSEAMRGETWAARVGKVREIVDRTASGERKVSWTERSIA